MLTFLLGLLLGGILGVFTIAMTVSAKRADEDMMKPHDK